MTRHHPDTILCGWRDDGVPEPEEDWGPEYDSYLARQAAEGLAKLPADKFRMPGVVQDVEAILDVLTARMKATRIG